MKNLLQMQVKDTWGYINNNIAGQYRTIISKKGHFVLYSNNQSPLLLQAHIDTVRDEKVPLVVSGDNILMGNGILGADDRAGIYAILQLVMRNGACVPNVLITNGEETGGTGMESFCKAIKSKKLKHINLCLAFDRQGAGEYVTYNDLPKEVASYISSFGFTENMGSFSDCQIFTEKYRIPSVNLSVGFHNQHTAAETLHMDELYMTIERVMDIVGNPIEKRYSTSGRRKWELDYGWSHCGYKSSWDGWKDKSVIKYKDDKIVSLNSRYCEFCGELAKTYYMEDIDSGGIYVCGKCYEYLDNQVYRGQVWK